MFRLGLLFISVTTLELYLLIQLNSVLGLPYTVAMILFTGFLGAHLARQQGFQVLRELTQKLNRGELPASEMIDGVCILIASALLVTPGILTDIVGFLLLTPPFRALVKLWLQKRIEGWIQNQNVLVMQSMHSSHSEMNVPFGQAPHFQEKNSAHHKPDVIDI